MDVSPSREYERQAVSRGAILTLPIAVSVFAYGLVFGLLSSRAGLSVSEALLMSALVYAGTAQFLALGMWQTPLPSIAIVLGALIVNLRFVLMGLSLGKFLWGLRRTKVYPSLFFLADETWALAVRESRRASLDINFVLGSGLMLYGTWLLSTLVGRSAALYLGDLTRWGLDFAFTALILALLVDLRRSPRDPIIWLIAATVSIIVKSLLDGPWNILSGALAGSLLGGFREWMLGPKSS